MRTLRQAEVCPSALKDVGEGQEVQHDVVLADWQRGVVALEGGVVHRVGHDDALRIARCAAGVEYVGNVLEARLLLALFDFRVGCACVQAPLLDEVVEILGYGVAWAAFHVPVENDDALERAQQRCHTHGDVVLLLLANEKQAHFRIVHHVRYLGAAARGVEWRYDAAYAVCAEGGKHTFGLEKMAMRSPLSTPQLTRARETPFTLAANTCQLMSCHVSSA